VDEVERTSIERWRAVRLIEIKENGRTRPLDVSCEPEDAEENEESNTTQRRYVVKTLGAEVTEQSLFNELFGGMLAGLLGVPSPPPAIILIDQEFIAAHVIQEALRKNPCFRTTNPNKYPQSTINNLITIIMLCIASHESDCDPHIAIVKIIDIMIPFLA
jgi:hypothetical protein